MFSESYPMPLIRYMLGDREAYSAFLASIRVIRPVSALNAPVNVFVRRPGRWSAYANLNHLVLRSYFYHATQARGCHRLVEKTPTNTAQIAALSRAFPRGQLLYIHRHPVDVFSSYRRRGQADPGAGWARALTPEEFCEMWERSTGRVLDWLARGNQNLLMVRYDDFSRSPQREFARVCRFLDEVVDPSVVVENEPDLGRWRGDPHLWGQIVPVTKRWQDFMSMAEAQHIQRRLAGMMKRLGYPPYAQPGGHAFGPAP
jgi:hypothetical protein